MAPTLRKSTQQKSDASTKAAKDAGYVRRPRAPLTHKQRYTRNKSLISMKIPKGLEKITLANAANSPLLRLPPELRNQIYNYVYGKGGRLAFLGSPPRLGHYDPPSTATTIAVMKPSLPPRLLLVSRLLYQETRFLPFTLNSFYCSLDNLSLLPSHLTRNHRELLTTVHIPTTSMHIYHLQALIRQSGQREWSSQDIFPNVPTVLTKVLAPWFDSEYEKRSKEAKRELLEHWFNAKRETNVNVIWEEMAYPGRAV